jgi:integrase
VKSKSLPKIKSRAEAYLCTQKLKEEILSPYMSIEDIKQHNILTIDEVKKIMGLSGDKPREALDTLIALLGITCGLSVSEIQMLKREQVTENDMIRIEADKEKRLIPIIGNVKDRIKKTIEYFPKSRYVIPNIKDMDKPCNPISINRGVESVISNIGINSERYIIPSVLKETFINLLVTCNKDLDMETLDYLCGFDVQRIELNDYLKSKLINTVAEMMIVLEKKEYSPFPTMKWLLG